MSATNQQKLEAAERELKLRLRVYPRLVASGRMSQAKADAETKIMDEIRFDYEQLANKEKLI